MKRADIYYAIDAERNRLEEVHGDSSAASRRVPDAVKVAILTEEVGEVACAVLDGDAGSPDDLRRELVQVAAVAVAWAECL